MASTTLLCCVCLGSAQLHSQAEGNPVVLLAYDSFGMRAPEMDAAQTTVSTILKLASVRSEWHACPTSHVSTRTVDPVCTEPLTDRELVVRIVTASAAIPTRSLGSALVDGPYGGGVLATVYADRVRSLASRAGVNPGLLLGRAIAHEVGHLLIGMAAHAPGGLMRARWSYHEVQRDLPGDWTWSRQDIVDIAQGIEMRARYSSSASPMYARVAGTTPVTTTAPTCRAGAKCPRQ